MGDHLQRICHRFGTSPHCIQGHNDHIRNAGRIEKVDTLEGFARGKCARRRNNRSFPMCPKRRLTNHSAPSVGSPIHEHNVVCTNLPPQEPFEKR